eukprot:7043967-Prymnesium_polylepis.1
MRGRGSGPGPLANPRGEHHTLTTPSTARRLTHTARTHPGGAHGICMDVLPGRAFRSENVAEGRV